MKKEKIEFEVAVLSTDEFGESYPQYRRYAGGVGKGLFSLVMSPKSFVAASIATMIGLPAVAGLADEAVQECRMEGREITRFDKQFIGAVTCALMEANGFRKTGMKRAVPHKAFSKAEFYKNDRVEP